jgi:hypothetical protein
LRLDGSAKKPIRFVMTTAGTGYLWNGIRVERASRNEDARLRWIELSRATKGVSFLAGAGSLEHAVLEDCGIGVASSGCQSHHQPFGDRPKRHHRVRLQPFGHTDRVVAGRGRWRWNPVRRRRTFLHLHFVLLGPVGDGNCPRTRRCRELERRLGARSVRQLEPRPGAARFGDARAHAGRGQEIDGSAALVETTAASRRSCRIGSVVVVAFQPADRQGRIEILFRYRRNKMRYRPLGRSIDHPAATHPRGRGSRRFLSPGPNPVSSGGELRRRSRPYQPTKPRRAPPQSNRGT